MTTNNADSYCPFCSNTKTCSTVFENTLFNGKIFKYRKCTACNLIYVQPFPDSEDYKAMYPPAYQGEVSAEAIYPRGFEKVITLIEKFSSKNKLLDFGCGNGSFLSQATKKGFTCSGVEFDSRLVEVLSKEISNASVYTAQEFENISAKFDIIHISNVLEHLITPREMMEKLKTHLEPDGIFIIYGPVENNLNVALLVRKLFFYMRKSIFKRENNHAPTHIFYSNSYNQRMFFHALKLDELYYEVLEQAWPFPSVKKQATGILKRSMYYIAIFSMLLKKLNRYWGNQFIYVGKLKN